MDIYNRLSSRYDSFYKRNFENFKDKVADVWEGDGWFVDFYPSFGIKANETCDLLFYGQAVNGWRSGFYIFDNETDLMIENSVLASNRLKERSGQTYLS